MSLQYREYCLLKLDPKLIKKKCSYKKKYVFGYRQISGTDFNAEKTTKKETHVKSHCLIHRE